MNIKIREVAQNDLELIYKFYPIKCLISVNSTQWLSLWHQDFKLFEAENRELSFLFFIKQYKIFIHSIIIR